MAPRLDTPSVCPACGTPFLGRAWQVYCGSSCANRVSTTARRSADRANHVALFWARVDQSGGPDACWPWTGSTGYDGYGRSWYRPTQRHRNAHVIAYVLTWGEPIPGMVVCHGCDNRSCCNPNHLWSATDAANAADMVRKNRQARGARNARTKLTPEQVTGIRRRYEEGDVSMHALAKEHGVDTATVRDLLTRRSWSYL